MHRRVIGAVAVVLAAAGCLTGCGGDKPDLAACKAAVREQLAKGISDPNAPKGTKPKECEGVSDADLERIGTEVLGEVFGGTPTP